jgi:transposase
MFAPALESLATWLEQHPAMWSDNPKLTPGNIRKWKSPGRLAALVANWRTETPPEAHGLLAELEEWRSQDKHLWEWECNERHQTTRHRDEVWRNVASWLTTTNSMIIVDDSSMADLRRKGPVEQDPNLPGPVEDAARARAAMVAPGRLRDLVTAAAARRGVTVTAVPAAGLSRVCAGCGHKGDGGTAQAASSLIVCDGCGKTYDQDQNAVRHMLTRALSSEDCAG